MNIFIGILVFCVVIIIHEMGHFFVAKACKMKVNEFAIGMGPLLFKKRFGETDYAIRLFPIGGAVMLDEDVENDDPRSFRNKPVWMRMLVIVAGAVMNLILGVIFCLFSVLSSNSITTTTVGGFHDGSVTSQYLQADDEIVEVNGMTIWTAMDISFQLQNSVSKSEDNQFFECDMKVLRDGEVVALDNVKFASRAWAVFVSDYKTLIGENSEFAASPAEYYNLEIAKVTEKFSQMEAKSENPQFVEGFKKLIENYKAEVVASENSIFLDFRVYGEEKDFFNVTDMTFKTFLSETRLIWISLGNLIKGTYGLNDLSGPIGVVQSIGQSASIGFNSLMLIAALITINVGIFNLLPIPALDGARFIFLLIEAIRRKPVKAEHEGLVHFIGLMALFLLMILVSINDIIKLIAGG